MLLFYFYFLFFSTSFKMPANNKKKSVNSSPDSHKHWWETNQFQIRNREFAIPDFCLITASLSETLFK